MNIQVDNPIVLLNQDAARSFLKDSEPKKLYELFLKATQIDVIIKKLDQCGQLCQESKTSLQAKKIALVAKNTEVNALKERYETLKSIEGLKNKVEKLKLEIAWARVKELEPGLKEKQKEIEVLTAKMDELIQLMSNRGNIDEEINQITQQMNHQIHQKQAVLGEIDSKYNEMRNNINKKDEELNTQNRKINKLDTVRKRFVDDIRQIEESLRENNADEVLNLRRQNEAELQKLVSRVTENDTLLANNQRELELLRSNSFKIESEYEGSQKRRNDITMSVQKAEGQLRQLSQAKADTLSVYGQHMPQLVLRIEQEHNRGRFSKLPRGPLGRYVEVPDRKWRGTVEFILKNGLMNAFFVNSDKDRGFLMQLIKREFPNIQMPNIITSKFVDQVYDISRGRVHAQPGTVSLIDVMKVKDPVVMNCFIDQVSI